MSAVKLDQSLKEAVSLAEGQGWRVEIRRTKAFFYPPSGGVPVVEGISYTTRPRLSLFSRLRQAGLVPPEAVPKKEAKPQEEETMPEPVPFPATGAGELKTLSDALDAVLQMVEELADQFVEFREHQSDNLGKELPALRGRLSNSEGSLVKLEEAVKKVASASDREQVALSKRLSKVEADLQSLADRFANIPSEPVDPIAAFRQRLKR